MIPDNIDIADLQEQLSDDHVAYAANAANSADAAEAAEAARAANDTDAANGVGELNDQLVDAVAYAEKEGFGPTGIVVLQETPPHTADMRDIGQTLLDNSEGIDTVLVRAPSSGAVVSTVHNRSELESAQFYFLDNPDIPAATRTLVDDVMESGVSWPLVGLAIAVVLIAAVAATVLQTKRRILG